MGKREDFHDDEDYGDEIPTYWIEQSRIVVQDDEVLPLRCVVTNVPVTQADMVTKTLYYVPVLLYIIMPFFLLPIAILILIIRKPVKVTYGVSPAVRHRRFIGKTISAVVVLSAIVLFIAAIAIEPEDGVLVAMMISALVMFFGGLIGLVMSEVQMSVTHYRKEPGRGGLAEFWLRGFSQAYLDQTEDEVEEFDRASDMRR